MESLAARETALAAIETARESLSGAVAALAELGIGPEQLAVMLEVPVEELGGAGAAAGGGGVAARVRRAPVAGAGQEPGAVRLWLAMIERGQSPKTHGLGQDDRLLCRGHGDADHLSTWIGYAFDVDCQRCAKVLAEELTDEEFG